MAALALVLAAGTARADGAWLALTDRQREEALRVGQRGATVESFGDEWRVVNGAGESVTVITPFHRLAWAARHAAFKNEAVKPKEQERLLEELKERLRFEVNLVGPREDFARYFRPRLLLGPRQIEPSLVQNERTGIRQENGTYLARCAYWFPSQDITGTSHVTLVVRNADGRDVTNFAIDLGTMR